MCQAASLTVLTFFSSQGIEAEHPLHHGPAAVPLPHLSPGYQECQALVQSMALAEVAKHAAQNNLPSDCLRNAQNSVLQEDVGRSNAEDVLRQAFVGQNGLTRRGLLGLLGWSLGWVGASQLAGGIMSCQADIRQANPAIS